MLFVKMKIKHVLRGVAQQLAILIRNRWMSSTRQFDPRCFLEQETFRNVTTQY